MSHKKRWVVLKLTLYQQVLLYVVIQNPWAIVLEHQRILQEIQMDARRVFIDQEFFQQTEILKITEEVLFTWSKQHKEKYQQGMLYILDIIIYIVSNSKGIDPFVNSYMMFDRIMGLGLSSYFGNMFGFLKRKCEVIVNCYLKTVDVEFFIYLNRAEVDISVVLM